MKSLNVAMKRHVVTNTSAHDIDPGVLAPGSAFLHVTNIANNAILNAQILNDAGYPSYVIQHDYYHFAACPEWVYFDSAKYDPSLLGDNDYFPNWWKLPSEARFRPRWYAQGPQHLAIFYLTAERAGDKEFADIAWDCLTYQRLKAAILRTTTPTDTAWTLEELRAVMADLCLTPDEIAAFERAQASDEALIQIWKSIRTAYPTLTFNPSAPFQPGYLDGFAAIDRDLAALLANLRGANLTVAYGLEVPDGLQIAPITAPPGVLQSDADAYITVTPWWRSLFSKFDNILAYGEGPIYTLLAGCPSYAAYEHGTIRTLPFQDSLQGRLIKASYLAAKRVFITNGDYVSASPRLEFAPGQAIYSPHAFDERAINELIATIPAKPQGKRKIQFFAPARQDWTRHDPISCKANHLIIEAMAQLVSAGNTNFSIEFVAWGQDLEATRALISERKLDSFVTWCQPLTKSELWKRYLSADGVLDQFLIGSLSGVSFEALAAGARVITLCGDDMAAFFGEAPPMLGAGTSAEICAAMLKIIKDPNDKAGIGEAARVWAQLYHSGKRMMDLELAAFAQMQANTVVTTSPIIPLTVRPHQIPKPLWQFTKLTIKHHLRRILG